MSESKPVKLKLIRTCKMCGETFYVDNHTQLRKYCDECRALLYYPHSKKEAHEQVCRLCGKKFVTDHPTQLYCSRECYAKHAMLRKREKRKERRGADYVPVVRYCLYCGNQLPEDANSQRLYCSHDCQHKDYERRKAAGLPSAVPTKSHNGSPATIYLRKCHDCGEPCNDYRCHSCWLKMRRKLGLLEYVTETESEWDGF